MGFVELGGERVYMTHAEVAETKYFGAPGMLLLGFKRVSLLESQHRIFHSYFVYPNERLVTGSASLCAALLEQMLSRKVMAIVRYIARRNSAPVLAALLPQAENEEPDTGGDQSCPPGFHMILLPWADDFRQLRFPPPSDMGIPPSLVEPARGVV